MNKKRIDELIKNGDEQLNSNNYKSAFEYYELGLASLSTDNLKDKRSKMLSSFAGWTAVFLTGGLGIQDFVIIPGVSKGVSKLLGVDDSYINLSIQSVCMREINCILQSEDIRLSTPQNVVLQRFALLLSANKYPISKLEILLDFYIPELSQKNSFDNPEVIQSPAQMLLEEIQKNDPINSENLYLLYSYLLKIGDNSQLFLALLKIFSNSNSNNFKQHYSRNYDSASSNKKSESDNYYEILGLKNGASKKNIEDAYHELMKKYHPDRFATLSKEFQELANRKAQMLNEAYEHLMKKI